MSLATAILSSALTYLILSCCSHFVDINKFLFNDLMAYIVAFMSRSSHIKNPYTRSKFAELLYSLTPKRLEKPLTFNPFELPFAYEHLGSALSKLYVEVEHTGGSPPLIDALTIVTYIFFKKTASTQFYDKFNIRFYISGVFRYMWKFPKHRENFLKVWSHDSNFLPFVNMLINDCIYLLDESLSKLAKIRSYQLEIDSPDFTVRYSPVRFLDFWAKVSLLITLHLGRASRKASRTRET